jgi:uronate dehydrogenase
MTRVLLTGAAGRIGTLIRHRLREEYPELILSDIREPRDLHEDERFVRADLMSLDELCAATAGMDAIIHFGGHSLEAEWQDILDANIVGTRNVFEAARLTKVKRVVFASSNHVLGFYDRASKQTIATIPLPDSRYGVSKVFGEAMGALYAHKYGLRVLVLRIGKCDWKPDDDRRLKIWLHPEDLIQLLKIGIESSDINYEIFFGCSDNDKSWWDNSRAYELGYKPQFNSAVFADEIRTRAAASKPSDPIADRFQGGAFCSVEYRPRSELHGDVG